MTSRAAMNFGSFKGISMISLKKEIDSLVGRQAKRRAKLMRTCASNQQDFYN